MSRARGIAVVGFAVTLLLGYFAWEWFLSPAARVKRTLADASAAAERLDADGLLSFVAADYSDFLAPDRRSLESRLREGFSRVDRLKVTLRAVEVSVEGDAATARFDLVVVAFRGDERFVVLGTPFEGEKVQADLVRETSGWKVARVLRSGRPGLER
jgi:SnoaL-like domain